MTSLELRESIREATKRINRPEEYNPLVNAESIREEFIKKTKSSAVMLCFAFSGDNTKNIIHKFALGDNVDRIELVDALEIVERCLDTAMLCTTDGSSNIVKLIREMIEMIKSAPPAPYDWD